MYEEVLLVVFVTIIGVILFVWDSKPVVKYSPNVNVNSQGQGLRGYKIFDEGWVGLSNLHYKVGQTVSMKELPLLGKRGFHFCLNAFDCTAYRPCHKYNKYALVEALGEVHFDGTEAVTNELAIIKELSHNEFVALCKSTQVSHADNQQKPIVTLQNGARYWHTTDNKLIRWESAFRYAVQK